MRNSKRRRVSPLLIFVLGGVLGFVAGVFTVEPGAVATGLSRASDVLGSISEVLSKASEEAK